MEPGHTFKDSDLAGLPSAGYFRVSSNPDETEQKSVNDQEAEYLGWAQRTKVKFSAADLFRDDDRSASMFATRQRENFARLRESIEADRYKVVWFWATSRQTRGDVNIYELAKVSADHGVLWCVGGQLLNPANEDDLLFLGIHHLMDRQYAWRISKDSRRGHKSIAYDGKPSGAAPYGYRRVYDYSVMVKGKPKFLRDEPNVFDGDGHAIQDSPAYIVREIYDRVAAGEPLGRIAKSLEAREISTPRKQRKYTDQPCRWTVTTVKFIATSPAYMGKRIYQAESWRVKDRHAAILDGVEAKWEALVTEELWWTVQRALAASATAKWRPGRGNHLLAGAVRCGICGTGLYAHYDGNALFYGCGRYGHVSIRADWLEAYVEDRIVSWAADRDVYTYLWAQREDDDATAVAARADVERLEHQLEECRIAGEDPEADAVFWERRARALGAKLAEARTLARPPSLSPVLADVIGPDAADNWWRLRKENIPAAKQLIAAVADIRIHRGHRGKDVKYRQSIDPGRISWAWLTGPGEDQAPVFGEPTSRMHDRVADALRADAQEGDRTLARELQCAPLTIYRVRRELEAAGEIPVIRRRGLGKPVSHGYRRPGDQPVPVAAPREMAAGALRADPGESDGTLAARLGVASKTVARARRELVEAGEIPAVRRAPGRAARAYGKRKP
jgi:DNA invertase Pin-like site-specific DNA recombinase